MDGRFLAGGLALIALGTVIAGSCTGGTGAVAPQQGAPASEAPAEKPMDRGASVPPAGAEGAPPRTPPWLAERRSPMTDLLLSGAGVVESANGVVTSVEDQATRAGASILASGGNAVDAAVATAFALAVTHPSAGNIGGGGFMLLKNEGVIDAIDFREDSPTALTDELFWKMIENHGGVGPASVGVPGTVAGLYLAHEKHGRLPWEMLLGPAIELAEKGYILGARQRQTIVWSQAVLRHDPVAKAALLRNGAAPAEGSRIKRPRLALALRRIRDEGPRGFYEGPTAKDIVDSVGKSGAITLAELQGYRARIRRPLHMDYRGYRVITMPPPSAGGVALLQNLAMLQALEAHVHPPLSAMRLHLIAEASRRAQTERRLFVVAPEAQSAEEESGARARWVDPTTWLASHPINREQATRSSTLHPLYAESVKELEHTTHLSVVDAQGNAVSCTVTLSGSFGSRIFTKETGITLNNSVASFSSVGHNTPAAARRTVSSMAPTLVLGTEDTTLVLGSPGGDTIPSTVTEVLIRLVDDGMSLQRAVETPRIHQGFVPDQLWMEGQHPLPTTVAAQLTKMGHRVVVGRRTIGDANIAAFSGGKGLAVADAREGGLAAFPTSTEDGPEEPPRDGGAKSPSSTGGETKQ